jgi:hypothetical protein
MTNPNQRAVFNAAYRIGAALGRKFEATDMTTELRQAAHLFASTYEGDFEYMTGMRDQANGGVMFFSDGQSKAVLNCLMADAKRRIAERPPKAAPASPTAPTRNHVFLKELPDGRYRVTLPNGESIALYITLKGSDSKLAGSRVISTRITGDDWMGVAHITTEGGFRLWRSCHGALRERVTDAVQVLDQAKTQDEWLVAGLAFAQESSLCFFCGRDLDTPESLTAGYGPTCADKHGLPWGRKAIPMSVRLAQAAAVPPIDPETGVEESAEELLMLVASTRPDTCRTLTEARSEGRPRTYAELFEEN